MQIRLPLICLALALLPIASAAQLPNARTPATDGAAAASRTVGAATHLPAARLAPGQPIPQAALESFVDGVVSDAMSADHLAGASVAIVQGGKVVMLKGYGLASINPAKPVDPYRTLFRIASTSKTFTWTLLLREVERGRIKLDAPINDYLPPEMRFSDEGFKRPIRVVDLMSHAAGFEDNDLANEPATDRVDRIKTLKAHLTNHRPARVREPGTISSYSNYGVALAGYILERVTGMDVPTLAERELFRPLKMNDTTFREPYPARAGLPAPMPAALKSRLVTNFKWNGSDFEPTSLEYLTAIGPAGSISMTTADMARYMLMHLGGGSLEGNRIYGPAAARAFRTPIMSVPEGINGWAHGLITTFLPGGFKGYGHGGAGLGSLNYTMWIPELDLGIFLITNTGTGGPVIFRFADLVVDHFYAPAHLARLPYEPSIIEQAGLYEGHYVNTRRSSRGLSKFLDLMGSVATVSVSKDGYLETPGQRWVPDGAPGRFRNVRGDARMVFTLDAEGRPLRYTPELGMLAMERAGLVLNPILFNLAAALTALASLIVLIRAFVRRRVEAEGPRSPAGWGLIAVSGLWLVAFVAMAAWAATLVEEEMVFRWPGFYLPLASTAALLATIGAVLLALYSFWNIVRRRSNVEGGAWRALCYGAVLMLFLSFGLLVGARGGLSPWY